MVESIKGVILYETFHPALVESCKQILAHISRQNQGTCLLLCLLAATTPLPLKKFAAKAKKRLPSNNDASV
jgi:hypothetical protein